MLLDLKCKIVFDPENKTSKHINQSSWKVTVICKSNDDIDKYYTWFLEKRFNLNINNSLRGPHITIINDKITDYEQYKKGKELFNGKEITFQYDPNKIRTNGKHYWINIESSEACAIREICGFTYKPYFGLHLTIGLVDDKYLAHSEYIHRQILKFGI